MLQSAFYLLFSRYSSFSRTLFQIDYYIKGKCTGNQTAYFYLMQLSDSLLYPLKFHCSFMERATDLVHTEWTVLGAHRNLPMSWEKWNNASSSHHLQHSHTCALYNIGYCFYLVLALCIEDCRMGAVIIFGCSMARWKQAHMSYLV